MVDAHPLQWPDGWPRTQRRENHLPGGYGQAPTWERTVDRLMRELRLLGATQVVLSTNQPLRRDGLPFATRRVIHDPGAAVYFQLKKRTFVMAQDRYWHLRDNIRSLALAIEGMRQMQRHGGGHMMERAFRGFTALPPAERAWREVLGFGPDDRPGPDTLTTAYRHRALKYHPDRGGSDAAMAELNRAYEQARKEAT